MAETKGFEPSRPFRAYSLSRGAPSTTRPRLRWRVYPCMSTRYKTILIERDIFLKSIALMLLGCICLAKALPHLFPNAIWNYEERHRDVSPVRQLRLPLE